MFHAAHVRSQTLPKLLVLPLPGEVGLKATQSVEDEFKKNQAVFLIDHAEVQNYLRTQAGSTSKDAGTLSAAEQKFRLGEEQYRKLKIKESINSLQEAKILFRQNLKSENAFEGLRSTQFYLAMAFQANNQEERAKDELRQVYVIDPERKTRKLPEKLYPPSIRTLLDDVKKEFSQKPTGDLEVISFPPGALAYVDGKSAGTTPATVKNLPVGEHFVRIVLDAKTDVSASKFVISGLNRFEPDLSVTLPQNIYQFFQVVNPSEELDHHRVSFLDSMGVTLGAEIFVFLTPGQQEVTGQLYDQRSQAVSSPISEKSPDLLVKKLMALIDPSGYVVAAPKAQDPMKQPQNESSARASSSPNFEPPTPSPLSEDLARQARRSRDGSWFSRNKLYVYAGGGALLVGAGVFFALSALGGESSNSVLNVSIP